MTLAPSLLLGVIFKDWYDWGMSIPISLILLLYVVFAKWLVFIAQ
jgi:hypothetical protein